MKNLLFALICIFTISCSRSDSNDSEQNNNQFNSKLSAVGLEKNVSYKIQKRNFYNGAYSYQSYSPEITVTFIDNNQIKEVQGSNTYISNYELINSNSNYPDPNYQQVYLKITSSNNSNNATVVTPTTQCYFEKSNGELKLFKDQSQTYEVFKFIK